MTRKPPIVFDHNGTWAWCHQAMSTCPKGHHGRIDWSAEMAINLTICPEPDCTQHAEIVEEQLWPSTSGGIFMAKVVGSCGHWFLMPAWQAELADFANEFPLAS